MPTSKEFLRELKATRERGDPRHSAAYHSLRKKYRTLVRAGYGDGPGLGWASLRDMLNADGQVNAAGRPFTAHTAMQLFKRVRGDVASGRAGRAPCPTKPRHLDGALPDGRKSEAPAHVTGANDD